jgi:hypothetical protein
VSDRQHFVELVSQMTGLDYRVVYAWTLAEEGQGLKPPGAHNWLNLRTGSRTKGYSGVPVTEAGAGFAEFRNVNDAARETAHWINKFSHYSGIRASVGKPPAAQLRAIIQSPWAGGHYNGGRSLVAAFRRAPAGRSSANSAGTGTAENVVSIVPYPPFVDPTDKLPGGVRIPDIPGLPTADDIAGSLAGFVLKIFLAGFVLALAAALFYNGVRRLSGDRLPSARDIAGTAATAAKVAA